MVTAFPEPSAFDHAGHLLLRAPAPFYLGLLPPDFVGDTLMVGPDSVAILRQDLTTRRVDTLVMLKASRNRQAVSRPAPGRGSGRPALNPIPSGDDWAVLIDGTDATRREHRSNARESRTSRVLADASPDPCALRAAIRRARSTGGKTPLRACANHP